MKREIKFRAKIKAKDFRVKLAMAGKPKNEGEWAYGEVHLQSTIPHIHEGMDKYPIDPDTVGQYTGLKDKNGKEIYEGDIVNITISNLNYLGKEYKSSVYKCICIYLEDEARFVLKNTKTDYKKKNKNWRHKSMVHIDIIKKEVIGNIFDNPELLKGGVE